MTERGDRHVPPPDRSGRWLAARFWLVVVAVALLATVAPAASAAGSTTVALETGGSDVAVGESVTVELVVASADRGVGGFIADIDLSNSNVANVTDVEFHGDPGLFDVVQSDDGVRFGAVLMDTDQTGSVAVAAVTLRAEAPGSTEVGLAIDPLADEDGIVYDVETSGTVLQATGSGKTVAPPDRGGGSGSPRDELDLGGFGADDGGEVVTSQTPNGSSTPTATPPTDSPSAPTTTTDDLPPESETTMTQTGGQPGFSLLVGGVSLAIVALIARLRRA